MNKNFLASFLDWSREVVEAAETPGQKWAIFVLPILAPSVPAFITGIHIYKLFIELFNFGSVSNGLSVFMSCVVGFVLELLGYVGAVMLVKAIFDLVRKKDQSYWLPVFMYGFSYVFYLALMFAINVLLDRYFNTPQIMSWVIGALSFITVPTGLIAANHLAEKSVNEEAYVLRQEARDDKLKAKALKQGINIFAAPTATIQDVPQATGKRDKHASDYKERIPVMLQEEYTKTGRVLELTEITARLKIPHAQNKGYVSTVRSQWMKDNGIEKPKNNQNALTF